MNGFRTSTIRADLNNKAEFSKVSSLLQWAFAIASFSFFTITIIFWGELLFSIYPKTVIGFFLLFIGFLFSLVFPAFACGVGYMWAKSTEYNRFLDSSTLVGAIGGQLSMNSANLHKGFMEAVELGRQYQMELDQQATEMAETKGGLDFNKQTELIDE